VNGLQSAAANHVYEDARAIAHTAIADLVNASKATTRLVNAVSRAHHRRMLPFHTIKEYVAAGEGRHVVGTGVGRKVANELDALIRLALANPTTVDRRDERLSPQPGEGEDGWRERIEAAVDAAA
jgi:hypothetical protein